MSDKIEAQRARNRKRKEQTCKHFNGLHSRVCRAGVDYQTVTEFPASRASRPPIDQQALACWKEDDADCSIKCGLREFYTAEEIDEIECRQYERIGQYFADLNNDVCPNHKIPITKKQIGRCIYADPCGCRLGQGKLKK